MIREATPDDIPRLLEYGSRWFHEESGYAEWVTFSPNRLADWFCWLIDGPDSILLIADGGMAAATLNGMYMTDDVTAHELLWRVEPEARGKGLGRALKNALEDWAKQRGAKVLTLSTLDALPLEPAGYTPVERGFIRRL